MDRKGRKDRDRAAAWRCVDAIEQDSRLSGEFLGDGWAKISEPVDENILARQASADLFAERILELAEEVVAGKLDPAAARVAIDALKWTASKLKPKRYGDTQRLVGDDGGDIEIKIMS